MQEQQQVWSQEECRVSRHSLFILLYCSQLTWYLLVAVPMLPIPQHGKFKDSPSFITICTPQGLAVKVTCIWILEEVLERAYGQELSFQLSMFVHYLARPKSLGIIAWLLHCSFLEHAVQKHGCFKASRNCCHEHPSLVHKKVSTHDGKLCTHDGWCACFAEHVLQGVQRLKYQVPTLMSPCLTSFLL
jgi:hypothetical protein